MFRDVGINELSAILARSSQALGMLICLRIITSHYGVELYGFFSLVIAVAGYLLVFDFGVISSLRSDYPLEYQKSGQRYANAIALQSFARLLIYSGSLLFAVFIVVTVSDVPAVWVQKVLIKSLLITTDQVKTAIKILLVYAAIVMAGNFVLAVISARQCQYRYYFLLVLGSIAQPICIFFASKSQIGSDLIFLILLITPVLPSIFLVFFEFKRIINNYKKGYRLHNAKKRSLFFFIIQIGGLIANSLDVVLIARLFSLREVAAYTTLKLIIQLAVSVHSGYILQLWPILSGIDLASGRRKIKKLFLRRLRLSIYGSMLYGLVMISSVPIFLSFWTQGELQVTYLEVALFAVLLNVFIIGTCLTVLCFAFKFVRLLAFLTPLSLPILYYSSLFFAVHFGGLSSVLLACILTQTLGIFAGTYFFIKFVK